jgi:hypothetical protein
MGTDVESPLRNSAPAGLLKALIHEFVPLVFMNRFFDNCFAFISKLIASNEEFVKGRPSLLAKERGPR